MNGLMWKRLKADKRRAMKDATIENVIKEFRSRSEVGIAKYGTTLSNSKQDTKDFLQHLKEELMDGVAYIQKLQELIGAYQPLPKTNVV